MTFIRVKIDDQEELINVDHISRIKPLGNQTRIYVSPMHYVDVQETYKKVAEKIKSTAGIHGVIEKDDES